MRTKYLLSNPGPLAIRVGDIDLPAGGHSQKTFDRDEVDYLIPELRSKGVRIYYLAPMDLDGPRFGRRRVKKTAAPIEASPRQRELYRRWTGQDFPAETSRIEASNLIESVMRGRMEADGRAERPLP